MTNCVYPSGGNSSAIACRLFNCRKMRNSIRRLRLHHHASKTQLETLISFHFKSLSLWSWFHHFLALGRTAKKMLSQCREDEGGQPAASEISSHARDRFCRLHLLSALRRHAALTSRQGAIVKDQNGVNRSLSARQPTINTTPWLGKMMLLQKCFNQFIFLFDSSRLPYSPLKVCVSSGFQVFRLLLSSSAVDGSTETFGWVDDRNQSITNLTSWELILEFSRCYKNVCVFSFSVFSLFFSQLSKLQLKVFENL